MLSLIFRETIIIIRQWADVPPSILRSFCPSVFTCVLLLSLTNRSWSELTGLTWSLVHTYIRSEEIITCWFCWTYRFSVCNFYVSPSLSLQRLYVFGIAAQHCTASSALILCWLTKSCLQQWKENINLCFFSFHFLSSTEVSTSTSELCLGGYSYPHAIILTFTALYCSYVPRLNWCRK